MPRAQQNDRSALCLLALLNLKKRTSWSDCKNPLVGITPMMEFARDQYGKRYAPNSRETFRRQTIHQMVAAGIALYNPDNPARPVNSPKAVYQIQSDTLTLLRSFGTAGWNKNLEKYLKTRQTLTARYAKEREMNKLPVDLATGETIRLSPGDHSELIKAIIEEFAPRYVPGGVLIYAGDTGDKWGYFDKALLAKLGVVVDGHGKMPDVVLYYPARKWLLLVESVTSHGPMDGKRHEELAELFVKSKAGLVYVTAFPSRAVMSRYLVRISWETEVWCADAPSHLMQRRPTTQDITWLLDLHQNKQLDLNPPYQRRSVWTRKDKQFFLDTIFRNYPSPAIFLHKTIDEAGKATYHVVDGKQRTQTILEFANDKLKVSSDYGDVRLNGKKWSSLQGEQALKQTFWNYQITVEMIDIVEGTIVNEVFDRLNRNSRKLTQQELRHAKFDGWLITTVENEAEKDEWRTLGVATTARVSGW